MNWNPTFTKASLGCHIDGSFGHKHLRTRLAQFMENMGHSDLAELLNKDMLDDAADEYDALEILNNHCSPEVYFDFIDGDLVLVEAGKGE